MFLKNTESCTIAVFNINRPLTTADLTGISVSPLLLSNQLFISVSLSQIHFEILFKHQSHEETQSIDLAQRKVKIWWLKSFKGISSVEILVVN